MSSFFLRKTTFPFYRSLCMLCFLFLLPLYFVRTALFGCVSAEEYRFVTWVRKHQRQLEHYRGYKGAVEKTLQVRLNERDCGKNARAQATGDFTRKNNSNIFYFLQEVLCVCLRFPLRVGSAAAMRACLCFKKHNMDE